MHANREQLDYAKNALRSHEVVLVLPGPVGGKRDKSALVTLSVWENPDNQSNSHFSDNVSVVDHL